MSVRVMALVWDRFPSGGTTLLALLALADWANDDGENCHPSIASIAKKIRTSESQARRVVHGLIQDGWLQVVGNEFGGAPKATRHYRIGIVKLEQTPSMRTRGRTSARGSMGVRDGSHGCAGTGCIAMTPEPSVEPPLTTKGKNHARNMKTPLPKDFKISSRVIAWAKEHGHRNLEGHFEHFILQAQAKGYTYADWDAAFMNAIRNDWAGPKVKSSSGRPVDNVRILRRGEYT